MARAVMRYAFAALLALLSTQAGVPSTRIVAAIEFVCTNAAEQEQVGIEARRENEPFNQPQLPLSYVSQVRPEPELTVHSQRPPPASFLFS